MGSIDDVFPNKDTSICISIASRPGNFGCVVHNAGYRALNLNFMYKSFGIKDQKGLISSIRTLGIRGCSVSMPFKQSIIEELDKLNPEAESIGAVNTIVNNDGILTGYNTDAFGASRVLTRMGVEADTRVFLLGAGGVARAILYALRQLQVRNIAISNRTPSRIALLDPEDTLIKIPWEERSRYAQAEMLINATSIGMKPDEDRMPLAENAIERYLSVVDVVVNPAQTRLIKHALSFGKTICAGYVMSYYQAVKQFELYTGCKAPGGAMADAMAVYLNMPAKNLIPLGGG